MHTCLRLHTDIRMYEISQIKICCKIFSDKQKGAKSYSPKVITINKNQEFFKRNARDAFNLIVVFCLVECFVILQKSTRKAYLRSASLNKLHYSQAKHLDLRPSPNSPLLNLMHINAYLS